MDDGIFDHIMQFFAHAHLPPHLAAVSEPRFLNEAPAPAR